MSNGPYLCYRELLSSSVVDVSIFFEAINESGILSEYLLVASTNNLALYKVNSAEKSSLQSDDSKSYLQLVLREQCYGKICDMKVLKRNSITVSKSKLLEKNTVKDQQSHVNQVPAALLNDLIVISFDLAKFMTIEYDAISKSFLTSNPLNVEEHAIGVGSSHPIQFRHKVNDVGIGSYPIMSIDQDEHIACSLLYSQYLFFFSIGTGSHHHHISSFNREEFVNDLRQSLQLYGPILDICFVKGYEKPTLAVLIESGSVPFGHVAKVRYSCTLAVIAVDFQHKLVSLLWKQSQMPHDSFKILPLPSTAHHNDFGVFVVSMNGVLKATRSQVTAVAMNTFGAATIHPTHRLYSSNLPIGYELDDSSWMVVDTSTYVGALKDGTMLTIEMLDPISSISTSLSNGAHHPNHVFKVAAVGMTVASSTICATRSGYKWFVGSRCNDAVLLQVTRSIQSTSTPSTEMPVSMKRDFILLDNIHTSSSNGVSNCHHTPSASVTPASKRQRRSSRNTSSLEQTPQASQHPAIDMRALLMEVEAEEILLYGEPLGNKLECAIPSRSYHLKVIDSISIIPATLTSSYIKSGAILDQVSEITPVASSTSLNPPLPASYIIESEAKDSLLISAGVNDAASIYKISNGLRLAKIASGSYGGATHIDTISDVSLSYSLLILSYTTSTKVYRLSHMLGEESSDMLQSEELKPEISTVLCSTSTITSGLIASKTMLQAFATGIRVIKLIDDLSSENEALQDMLLHENEELGGLAADADDIIVEACVGLGYVLLLTQYSNFYAIEYSMKDELLSLKYSKSVLANPTVAMNGSWDIIPVSTSLFRGSFRLKYDANDGHDVISTASNCHHGVGIPMTAIEAEEMFLYGSLLPAVDNKENDMDSNDPADETKESSSSHHQPHQHHQQSSSAEESDIAVIVDSEGVISFYSLSNNLDVICRFSTCAEKPDILSPYHNDNSASNIIADNIHHRLTCCSLVEISPSSDSSEPNILLVGVSVMGDLLVYQATYHNGYIANFHKIHHQHQLMSRQAINRRTSKGYQNINSASYSYQISDIVHLNGLSGIIVSGLNPAFIASSSSTISVYPLGFPELPYIHHGMLSIVSLRVGMSLHGLVTLWTDKIDNSVEMTYARSSAQQQAIVGFYRDVPSLFLPPANSSDAVSLSKISTNNMTIHRLVELTKSKAEDRIEQQILERNTMIASSSQDIVVPFRPEVLTEADVANLQADFAYYFADVTSWFQPNDPSSITTMLATAGVNTNHIGTNAGVPIGNPVPPPHLIDREYRVVLMQDGSIVDEYFLGENERILDLEVAYVSITHPVINERRRGPAPPVMKSEKKVMMLVGTCIADRHGEDTPADGRLLLFALDYTKLSNNQLQAKLKLSSIAVGPASIVRQFSNDRILSTMGPSLVIYRLEYEADVNAAPGSAPSSSSTVLLEQISFYYAKFYITSVTIVKNYIFIADAANRIELLVWRDADWSLTLLSKDYSKATMSRAIEVINDGGSLATIVGDDEANIQVLQFDPRREVESIQGAKLLCIADFHLGSEVSTLVRHTTLASSTTTIASTDIRDSSTIDHHSIKAPAKPYGRYSMTGDTSSHPAATVNDSFSQIRGKTSSKPDINTFGAKMIKSSAQKSCVVVGTIDGSIGVFIPVEEKVFKRLNLLQHLMSMSLKSICSLNPKDYRVYKSCKFRWEKKKGVLDGTMLWKFISLPTSLQNDLAATMGTSVDIILDNLYEMNMMTQHF